MQAQKKRTLSDAQITEAAKLFGILSEPSRLILLRTLMESAMTVTELVETTGLKQGNVSKHLGVLLEARFVAKEKDGNFARYSIADPNLFALCKLMCERIEQDAKNRLSILTAKPRKP